MPEIDWEHWKSQPIIYLHEVIALSCNIDPGDFTNPSYSGCPNVDSFDQRLRIAKKWARRPRGGFRARVSPTGAISVFLPEVARWVLRMATKFPTWRKPEPPEEFWEIAIEEIASAVSPAAPKSAPENKPGKPTSAGAPTPTAKAKAIDPRERKTLYKIIIVLVKDHPYDMEHLHATAGKILKLVEKAGFDVDQDTIWRHLAKAAELPKDTPVIPPDGKATELPKDTPVSPPDGKAANLPNDKPPSQPDDKRD
jgi:hypothetical protein